MVAGVATLGLIMAVLDTTIVNVALDTLSRELHSQRLDTSPLLGADSQSPEGGYFVGC